MHSTQWIKPKLTKQWVWIKIYKRAFPVWKDERDVREVFMLEREGGTIEDLLVYEDVRVDRPKPKSFWSTVVKQVLG